MANLNRVQIIGRVGQDPALGQALKFSVATSDKWTDKNGAPQEKTEWHNIVAFGKLAEIGAKYISKGDLIYIEGKLQTQSYEDKEGIKRYSTNIIASNIQFLQSSNKQSAQTNDNFDFSNGDIPF